MRWVVKAWRRAAGRAGNQLSIDTDESNGMDPLGLTEEQHLSRYQRASRLTC